MREVDRLIVLAHGALGAADEVSALVVVLAVVAYVLVIWIGDRRGKKPGKADDAAQQEDSPTLPPD